MLIVAEKAACAHLINSLGFAYGRIALARLLQAYLDGLHVLALPPVLCEAIEGNQNFSPDERAAARKLRQKYAEFGGLARQISIFARLTDESSQAEPIRVGPAWEIPLRWLADQQLHETQLVAEDLNDIAVLVGAAQDSLLRRRFFAFRVRAGAVAGGGGNSHRVLDQKARVERRITICVADSDKECPSSPLGETATKCQSVVGPGLYELRLTQGRAIENALPWRLLDKIRPQSRPLPSTALSRVQAVSKDAPSYINLKRGVFGHDVNRLAQTSCGTFWQDVRALLSHATSTKCCAIGCSAKLVGSCTDRFIDGYGSSTVADAGAWLTTSATDTSRHTSYVDSSDATEWRGIGDWISEYCLGMPARRF